MKFNKIIMQEYGDTDVLLYKSFDLKSPDEDEVQIEVKASGVNYIDIYKREGLLSSVSDLPQGIGVEAVGIISAIGNNVVDFNMGDRVVCVGNVVESYSSSINISKDRIISVPDDLSDDIVAAYLFKGLTVEYLINRCYHVQENATVLWHAAAGGVGTIAVKWLKIIGATIIGTVSTESKKKIALEQGCDYVIVTSEEDFESKVQEVTKGVGVDVVYDSIGKDTFDKSLRCLKERGSLILFGNSSGNVENFNVSLLGSLGSLYITRPSISHYIKDTQEFKLAVERVFSFIQNDSFSAGHINKYELSDAQKVHQLLQSRKTTGSMILVPKR